MPYLENLITLYMMKRLLYAIIYLSCHSHVAVYAQQQGEHQQPGLLNPVIPGYFADPTIKKIGDTYYIYATTDGNGGGLGPSQVWTSKDFRHWTIQPMNWPNTHWYWAPDMTQGYDGRYYLYYSQPVEIYGAVSDTPVGPWTSLAPGDQSIIPNYMIPGVITLDGQTFTDDDGKIYMFWGTWGIYPDHGCAVGLLREDMKSFEMVELIPNTVAKEFFEAPFMFKRNGVYYLMYSSGHCEDHTYRVQYVKSAVGPMGPFEYPDHNPILVTNEDGTIHGPGHHSVLEEDGRYYIVYHRHNNPRSGGGFHRQIAIDEMFFDENDDIRRVVPTHKGVSDLVRTKDVKHDLAFGKPVDVSSYYSEDFRPSFAVDDHNGTLWRSKENHQPAWISIDLGEVQDVRTVLVQFEYPTYAYQYRVETSRDGRQWESFVDRSDNNRWASPILEHGNAAARYVRLHILNTQLPGLPRGIWNIKVFGERLAQETIWSGEQEMPVEDARTGKLLHIDADAYSEGQRVDHIDNKGVLLGTLEGDRPVAIKHYQGKKAFFFDGKTALKSSFGVPVSLSGNSPFTVSMWVNNPVLSRFEHLVAWSTGRQDLTRAIFGYGSDANTGAVIHGAWPDMGYSKLPEADTWHHIVITFDGYMERIYVDGALQKEENRMLFVRSGNAFVIGASDVLDQHYSGYLADLNVYNESRSAEDIQRDYAAATGMRPVFSIQTEDLPIGRITQLRNHGDMDIHTISCQGCEVRVRGQRISLDMDVLEDSILSDILGGNSYSIEFDAFDGKEWNHIVLVDTNNVRQLYVNGQLRKSKELKRFINIQGQQVRLKSKGLQLFRASPGSLTAQDVERRFGIWQEKSRSEIFTYQPTAVVEPQAINEDHVFMQIKHAPQDANYFFSTGAHQSGWIEQPYYLFDKHELGKTIEIFAKDEFGNVSLPLVIRDPVFTAPTLVSGPTDADKFDSSRASIPFWDGYSVSPLMDSTQTRIQLERQVWKLSSKHTRWGEPSLVGPFVFKELEGDFTVEVRVKDVAGLSAQSRTSSESGIMIQDSANPMSYINNTVLTGWNLGNLSRSVGPRLHQEGNNGTGLAFEPYLQVQKVGKLFYLRSSPDGKTWTDLPNTPFTREDLDGKRLKVGLYQVAGNNQEGYGEFEEVKLYQSKDR